MTGGRPQWMTGARGDVLLYSASAVLAAGLAAVTIYHGHRVWGLIAAGGYGTAAVVTLAAARGGRTLAHGRRVAIAAALFVGCAVVPLAVLVAQRTLQVPWSAQPEVAVVERMARLLLDTGTPYAVDGLTHFEDYSPYLPAMAAFGLPRAVFGASAATDARLYFIAAAALLGLLAVRLLGARPLPVRGVQLIAVLPATTLTAATGGDDLPVLALLVLACVCGHTGRVIGCGIAGGLALAMKLTAAPLLLVLAVALWVATGPRRAVAFSATALGTATVMVLPVALVAPPAMVEHVIRFPAGLTGVDSPAASPLPGYLLAQTGTVGRALAIALLTLAALVLLGWVLRRPPRTAAQAAERAAAGLVVAMLLMPATRFGYLIYPLVLTGTAIALRSNDDRNVGEVPTSSWFGWRRPAPAT